MPSFALVVRVATVCHAAILADIALAVNNPPNCDCSWIISDEEACSDSTGECYQPCEDNNPDEFCKFTKSAFDDAPNALDAPNCDCSWISDEDACSDSTGKCYQPCKDLNPDEFCKFEDLPGMSGTSSGTRSPHGAPGATPLLGGESAAMDVEPRCQHTSYGKTDKNGDTCADYADNVHWCRNRDFDSSDFTSVDMCCDCGGGTKIPTAAQHRAQLAPARSFEAGHGADAGDPRTGPPRGQEQRAVVGVVGALLLAGSAAALRSVVVCRRAQTSSAEDMALIT